MLSSLLQSDHIKRLALYCSVIWLTHGKMQQRDKLSFLKVEFFKFTKFHRIECSREKKIHLKQWFSTEVSRHDVSLFKGADN